MSHRVRGLGNGPQQWAPALAALYNHSLEALKGKMVDSTESIFLKGS